MSGVDIIHWTFATCTMRLRTTSKGTSHGTRLDTVVRTSLSWTATGESNADKLSVHDRSMNERARLCIAIKASQIRHQQCVIQMGMTELGSSYGNRVSKWRRA